MKQQRDESDEEFGKRKRAAQRAFRLALIFFSVAFITSAIGIIFDNGRTGGLGALFLVPTAVALVTGFILAED